MSGRRDDGRMQPSVAITLALIGLACLVLVTRGCTAVGFHHLGWGGSGWFGPPLFGLLSTGLLIQLGLAVWVGLDAQRRGSNGWLWGLLVAFAPVVGLVVYLIVLTSGMLQHPFGETPAAAARAEAPATPAAATSHGACPHCARAVEAEFRVCPYCGGRLGCAECGRPLAADWRVCPFCGTSAGTP